MKILLIDRDAELAALIAFTLKQAGHDSYLASDGPGALQVLGLQGPDLALVEHHAPEIDGVQICREFRLRSRIPIMMLSAHDREDDLVAAFEAGADDFLRKPFSPRVLLARVKSLLRRAGDASPKVLTARHVRLDLDERALHIGESPPVRLTPHETTALRLLMSTPGRTVTAERLLVELWGSRSAHTKRVLKQLIYRLRLKIEVDPSAPRLIVTTPNAGYRFNVDAAP